MKKLLYLLLLTPIIFLTSCSKSGVTPQSQSLEDVIVGVEWSLSNENEDGFLLAEDGKFYLTQKCQSNTHFGNWEIVEDVIKYKYTSSSQELTTILGEVTEYSESQIKLLDYSDSLVTIDIYILDPTDIYGCMDVAAINYNPAAECDEQGSCLYIIPGCTDSTACNYNPISNEDDGTCILPDGCTNPTASNYNPSALCDDGSCADMISIGDAHQGGIVFYIVDVPIDLNGDGSLDVGLISAPSDQPNTAGWGCSIGNIYGADGTAIGTGAQNTIDIEAVCTSSGTAADICANYTYGTYSDWFLPSKDELNLMYLNIGQGNALGLGNVGGFANNYYWSSSEYDNYVVWGQHFYFGYQNYVNKYSDTGNVRAIRAF